jgi:hypothetical protein
MNVGILKNGCWMFGAQESTKETEKKFSVCSVFSVASVQIGT